MRCLFLITCSIMALVIEVGWSTSFLSDRVAPCLLPGLILLNALVCAFPTYLVLPIVGGMLTASVSSLSSSMEILCWMGSTFILKGGIQLGLGNRVAGRFLLLILATTVFISAEGICEWFTLYASASDGMGIPSWNALILVCTKKIWVSSLVQSLIWLIVEVIRKIWSGVKQESVPELSNSWKMLTD